MKLDHQLRPPADQLDLSRAARCPRTCGQVCDECRHRCCFTPRTDRGAECLHQLRASLWRITPLAARFGGAVRQRHLRRGFRWAQTHSPDDPLKFPRPEEIPRSPGRSAQKTTGEAEAMGLVAEGPRSGRKPPWGRRGRRGISASWAAPWACMWATPSSRPAKNAPSR